MGLEVGTGGWDWRSVLGVGGWDWRLVLEVGLGLGECGRVGSPRDEHLGWEVCLAACGEQRDVRRELPAAQVVVVMDPSQVEQP